MAKIITPRLPYTKFPDGLELDYFRKIRFLHKKWLNDDLIPELSRAYNIRFDSYIIRNDDLFDDILKKWINKVLAFKTTLKSTVNLVDKFAGTNLQKQVKTIANIDIFNGNPFLTADAETWAEINAELIKNIGQQDILRIKTIISEGLQYGTGQAEIKKQILNQVNNIDKRRAAVIARDQMGKLHGQITKYKQTSLGIEYFIWRTSKDQRVRDSHHLEGQVYAWNRGAPSLNGAIPGQEIQCRCIGEPYFPESDFMEGMEVV